MANTEIDSQFHQFTHLPCSVRAELISSEAKFLTFVLEHKASSKNQNILLCCFSTSAAKKQMTSNKLICEISAIDMNNNLYMIGCDKTGDFPVLAKGKINVLND